MIHKTNSEATSVVEQTRREAGVLSVTRSSLGIISKFFLQFFL